MAYTTIDKPSDYFNVVNYTGNHVSGSQSVTGVGHQPDIMWSKAASTAWGWQKFDTNRGGNYRQKIVHLGSYVEDNDTDNVTAWGSDGFTLGGDNQLNTNGELYHAFCWKANGGTTSSNTTGNITTTVQVNSTAKLSLFTYTGNASGAGQTIGHGLGVKPDWIQIMRRDSAFYRAYHKSFNPAVTTSDGEATRGGELASGTPSPPYDIANAWNDAEPTTTLITLGSSMNTNSGTYVGVAWAEVQGYSNFGYFKGNGSTNGPFVYTGFKPKYVWIRNVSRNNNAAYYASTDISSLTGIGKSYETNPITTGAVFDAAKEANYSQWLGTGNDNPTGVSPVDFYSNGFKVLSADGNVAFGPSAYGINPNDAGENYIYGAWAESPFVSSGGVAGTAR